MCKNKRPIAATKQKQDNPKIQTLSICLIWFQSLYMNILWDFLWDFFHFIRTFECNYSISCDWNSWNVTPNARNMGTTMKSLNCMDFGLSSNIKLEIQKWVTAVWYSNIQHYSLLMGCMAKVENNMKSVCELVSTAVAVRFSLNFSGRTVVSLQFA